MKLSKLSRRRRWARDVKGPFVLQCHVLHLQGRKTWGMTGEGRARAEGPACFWVPGSSRRGDERRCAVTGGFVTVWKGRKRPGGSELKSPNSIFLCGVSCSLINNARLFSPYYSELLCKLYLHTHG